MAEEKDLLEPFNAEPFGNENVSLKPIKFTCPTMINEFSLNPAREIQFGRSQVRYLCEGLLKAPKGINLNRNYSTYIQKDQNEKLDIILRWIQLMGPPKTEFVTWRGVLTRIAVSPYERDDTGLKVACTRHKGIIFICEIQTAAKLNSEANANQQQKMSCYWGHKFEQCVTANTPDGEPDTSAPVNTGNEFCTMLRANLGNKDESFRLIYGAESYLANISTLIVGIRDNNGIVQSIESVPVSSLSKNSKSWDYNKCLVFLHSFLKRIKEILETLPEGQILVAERTPKSKLFYFTIEHENSGQHSFINDDFKQHFS